MSEINSPLADIPVPKPAKKISKKAFFLGLGIGLAVVIVYWFFTTPDFSYLGFYGNIIFKIDYTQEYLHFGQGANPSADFVAKGQLSPFAPPAAPVTWSCDFNNTDWKKFNQSGGLISFEYSPCWVPATGDSILQRTTEEFVPNYINLSKYVSDQFPRALPELVTGGSQDPGYYFGGHAKKVSETKIIMSSYDGIEDVYIDENLQEGIITANTTQSFLSDQRDVMVIGLSIRYYLNDKTDYSQVLNRILKTLVITKNHEYQPGK